MFSQKRNALRAAFPGLQLYTKHTSHVSQVTPLYLCFLRDMRQENCTEFPIDLGKCTICVNKIQNWYHIIRIIKDFK